MVLDNITLKNFRNYAKLTLNLSSHLNFFVGKNGSGKTNIIEALSILAHLKSFRNTSDANIIQWGAEGYYCKVEVKECEHETFSVGYSRLGEKSKKKARLDNQNISRLVDYYGKLLTVIFSPDDIILIQGAPEFRRKYFDAIISKIDNEYLSVLTDFKKILTTRNRLLKDLKERKTKDRHQLDVWNIMLAEKSFFLVEKRQAFIKDFSGMFTSEYQAISLDNNGPELQYRSLFKDKSREEIISMFEQNTARDIIMGTTTIGIQRDNYILKGNNNILFIQYASQGEKRTAAIALKKTEKNYIEKIKNKKVIVLVDDIFSELDKERRENMVQLFHDNNQVLFTMANKELLDIHSFTATKIFTVENGSVRPL